MNFWQSNLSRKNTKKWYTIDALGAIYAIFTILDTLTILVQYLYNSLENLISQNVVDGIDIIDIGIGNADIVGNIDIDDNVDIDTVDNL